MLEMVGGGLRDGDAGLARTGEGDDRDVRMADERASGGLAEAVHDVDDARRATRVGQDLDEALGEQRRVLRGLQHDGVAADERRSELPGRDGDRKVPRRDRADDADRHPHAHHELVPELGRRRLAVHAASLACHVEAHVDRLLDVAAGLRLDLAHLVRHQVGQLGLALGEEGGEAVQHLRALGSRSQAPLVVGRARGRDGAVDVFGPGLRKRAEHLAGRGTQALERLPGGGIDPLAADEVLEGLRLGRRHAATLAERPSRPPSPRTCPGSGRGGGRAGGASRPPPCPGGDPSPAGGDR